MKYITCLLIACLFLLGIPMLAAPILQSGWTTTTVPGTARTALGTPAATNGLLTNPRVLGSISTPKVYTDAIEATNASSLVLTAGGDDLTIGSDGVTSTGGAGFIGVGANLTGLNASALGIGTIPDARFPAVLPAIDGSLLTGITGGSGIPTAAGGIGTNTSLYTTDNTAVATGAALKLIPQARPSIPGGASLYQEWSPPYNPGAWFKGKWREVSLVATNTLGSTNADVTFAKGYNFSGNNAGVSSYGDTDTNQPSFVTQVESHWQNLGALTQLEWWNDFRTPYTIWGTNFGQRFLSANLVWNDQTKEYSSSDGNITLGKFDFINPRGNTLQGVRIEAAAATSRSMNLDVWGTINTRTNDVGVGGIVSYGGSLQSRAPQGSLSAALTILSDWGNAAGGNPNGFKPHSVIFSSGADHNSSLMLSPQLGSWTNVHVGTNLSVQGGIRATNIAVLNITNSSTTDAILVADVNGKQLEMVVGANLTYTAATRTLDASGGAGDAVLAADQSFTGNNVFTRLRRLKTDLAGGTALTVGRDYYDTFTANRTLTFSGTPNEGDVILLHADVTTESTLTVPTSELDGGDGTTVTSVLLPVGYHNLCWIYVGAEWVLSGPSTSSGNVPEYDNGQDLITFNGNNSASIVDSGGVVMATFTTSSGAIEMPYGIDSDGLLTLNDAGFELQTPNSSGVALEVSEVGIRGVGPAFNLGTLIGVNASTGYWESFTNVASLTVTDLIVGNDLTVSNVANLGLLRFDTNAGVVALIDQDVTSASTAGTVHGSSIKIDGALLMQMQAQSNEDGSVTNPVVKTFGRFATNSTTAFVLGTRYTNGTQRAWIAASISLTAAAAGTAIVSVYAEQNTVTNKLTVSAGPLASLVTIEPLNMMIAPGAFYYFTDETSGAGASVAIVANTSSKIEL